MSPGTSRSEKAGFALIEAMLALLLLAVAMLGAVAAMAESLAGQRGALLQTRAADLASDLAEALRAAPDAAMAATEIESWQALVQQQLPLARASVPASLTATGFLIRLQWRDGRAATPSQLLLPLGILNPQPLP